MERSRDGLAVLCVQASLAFACTSPGSTTSTSAASDSESGSGTEGTDSSSESDDSDADGDTDSGETSEDGGPDCPDLATEQWLGEVTDSSCVDGEHATFHCPSGSGCVNSDCRISAPIPDCDAAPSVEVETWNIAGVRGLFAGDLDGDGQDELIAFKDQGVYQLDASSEILLSPFAAPHASVLELDVADIDNDGDLDLLFRTGGSGEEAGLWAIFGDEASGFGVEAKLDENLFVAVEVVASAEDGLNDLLLGRKVACDVDYNGYCHSDPSVVERARVQPGIPLARTQIALSKRGRFSTVELDEAHGRELVTHAACEFECANMPSNIRSVLGNETLAGNGPAQHWVNHRDGCGDPVLLGAALDDYGEIWFYTMSRPEDSPTLILRTHWSLEAGDVDYFAPLEERVFNGNFLGSDTWDVLYYDRSTPLLSIFQHLGPYDHDLCLSQGVPLPTGTSSVPVPYDVDHDGQLELLQVGAEGIFVVRLEG